MSKKRLESIINEINFLVDQGILDLRYKNKLMYSLDYSVRPGVSESTYRSTLKDVSSAIKIIKEAYAEGTKNAIKKIMENTGTEASISFDMFKIVGSLLRHWNTDSPHFSPINDLEDLQNFEIVKFELIPFINQNSTKIYKLLLFIKPAGSSDVYGLSYNPISRFLSFTINSESKEDVRFYTPYLYKARAREVQKTKQSIMPEPHIALIEELSTVIIRIMRLR